MVKKNSETKNVLRLLVVKFVVFEQKNFRVCVCYFSSPY